MSPTETTGFESGRACHSRQNLRLAIAIRRFCPHLARLHVRLEFQYESAIDTLLAKGLINPDLAVAAKERFYDSLNRPLAKIKNENFSV